MSLPNDSRSPARQHRTVEIYNADSVTIPPHAVVEIISGTAYENDNRTVYNVQRPTKDGSVNVLINGLGEIEPGQSSQVATNDYPTWALYDGQPSVGQMWGPVKDSFKLGYGRPGFIVANDYAVPGGGDVVRVTRHERLFRAVGSDAFHPGSSQDCYLQRWDGADWIDTDTEVTVQDPFFRTFALPNESFFVENYGDEWFAVGEQGLRREGLVLSGSNGSYIISIYASAPSQSCTGSDTGVVVSACYNGCAELSVGDRVWVHYHPEFRAWKCIPLCVNGLIRFEMLTELPLGGQGTAIEIGTGPAFLRIGSSFPIKDPHQNPGSWRFDPQSAVSMNNRGYMGWCVIPANPELVNGVPCREIVYMEQIARSIEFELNSDMATTGFAIASITSYYIGKDPSQTDLMTGSRLLVYDSQSNYPRALEGALGKARYNDRLHRYEAIEINQQAILLRASLSAMCPDDSSGGVTGYNVMTFPPLGQRPRNVQGAENIHNLSNGGAATATLAWDESNETWIILQVEHQTLELVNTGTIAAGDCVIGLELTRYITSAMTCGQTDEVASYVQFDEQDVITGVTLNHTQGSAGSGNNPPSEGSCYYTYTKSTVCVLSSTSAASTQIDMDPVLIVQDVYDTGGNCIGITVAVGYVPCLDSQDDLDAICGTTCDSGSS